MSNSTSNTKTPNLCLYSKPLSFLLVHNSKPLSFLLYILFLFVTCIYCSGLLLLLAKQFQTLLLYFLLLLAKRNTVTLLLLAKRFQTLLLVYIVLVCYLYLVCYFYLESDSKHQNFKGVRSTHFVLIFVLILGNMTRLPVQCLKFMIEDTHYCLRHFIFISSLIIFHTDLI